jgi:hypothetical protein
MPTAVMTSGTISGEINSAIMSFRAGIYGLLSPNAAVVPRTVANIVAKKAMNKLFTVPFFHQSPQGVVNPGSEQSPIMYRYHLVEKASGSNATIPGVKLKKGSAVKESGTTTMSGATRKKNTSEHMTKYV